MSHSKQLAEKAKFDIEENQLKSKEFRFLEDLPLELREVLEFGLTMQKYPGPFTPSIASKITKKHIDKILDLTKDDSDKNYKANLWNMGMRISILMIVTGLFVFLTYYFGRTDKELYLELVKVIIAFLGRVGIGYGMKAKKA